MDAILALELVRYVEFGYMNLQSVEPRHPVRLYAEDVKRTPRRTGCGGLR
jgi:hypothetical protein